MSCQKNCPGCSSKSSKDQMVNSYISIPVLQSIPEMPVKAYHGAIPAAGIFCGGCPTYTRENDPCPGVSLDSNRSDSCAIIQLCSEQNNVDQCYQCEEFPCKKFKGIAMNWLKYGQDLISNQRMLEQLGTSGFITHYNAKVNA